ncbi:hypothetical protein M5K25_019876 [Dendrobium thyrsiflorum]|uniref:Uncharacterized protein n=1 Tax=Dendrobium thyrsiflorum TaxID=117978 RepID=A0ABD0UG30_DENTH
MKYGASSARALAHLLRSLLISRSSKKSERRVLVVCLDGCPPVIVFKGLMILALLTSFFTFEVIILSYRIKSIFISQFVRNLGRILENFLSSSCNREREEGDIQNLEEENLQKLYSIFPN